MGHLTVLDSIGGSANGEEMAWSDNDEKLEATE